MILIDDETFIDTSLITCAEYQLFIDKELQCNRFHQPLHWKIYSFPTGQGNAPILGVRPSDALAFCSWLTERNSGIWRYRLPTLNEYAFLEAEKNFEVLHPKEVGYWIEQGKTFGWARRKPPSINPTIKLIQKLFNDAHINIQDSDIKNVCSRNYPPNLDYIWERVCTLNFDNILDPTVKHAQLLKSARYINNSKASRIAYDLEYYSGLIRNIGKELNSNMANILTYTNKGQQRDERIVKKALENAYQLVAAFKDFRNTEFEHTPELPNAYDYCFDLTVALKVFQARIEGSILPCEGILLVKERIKV